jgi:hypothetical protein
LSSARRSFAHGKVLLRRGSECRRSIVLPAFAASLRRPLTICPSRYSHRVTARIPPPVPVTITAGWGEKPAGVLQPPGAAGSPALALSVRTPRTSWLTKAQPTTRLSIICAQPRAPISGRKEGRKERSLRGRFHEIAWLLGYEGSTSFNHTLSAGPASRRPPRVARKCSQRQLNGRRLPRRDAVVRLARKDRSSAGPNKQTVAAPPNCRRETGWRRRHKSGLSREQPRPTLNARDAHNQG